MPFNPLSELALRPTLDRLLQVASSDDSADLTPALTALRPFLDPLTEADRINFCTLLASFLLAGALCAQHRAPCTLCTMTLSAEVLSGLLEAQERFFSKEIFYNNDNGAALTEGSHD